MTVARITTPTHFVPAIVNTCNKSEQGFAEIPEAPQQLQRFGFEVCVRSLDTCSTLAGACQVHAVTNPMSSPPRNAAALNVETTAALLRTILLRVLECQCCLGHIPDSLSSRASVSSIAFSISRRALPWKKSATCVSDLRKENWNVSVFGIQGTSNRIYVSLHSDHQQVESTGLQVGVGCDHTRTATYWLLVGNKGI